MRCLISLKQLWLTAYSYCFRPFFINKRTRCAGKSQQINRFWKPAHLAPTNKPHLKSSSPFIPSLMVYLNFNGAADHVYMSHWVAVVWLAHHIFVLMSSWIQWPLSLYRHTILLCFREHVLWGRAAMTGMHGAPSVQRFTVLCLDLSLYFCYIEMGFRVLSFVKVDSGYKHSIHSVIYPANTLPQRIKLQL